MLIYAIDSIPDGQLRGSEPIYPASVVKLFYLVAAHRWLEDGKLKDTEELQRALRDMIVDSSNDATHYLVDALTGTANGVELPPEEMREWAARRNIVQRYFTSLGYAGINVVQKPWCEGPYGRERAFLGANYENRNKLTTDATARLLAEIVTGRAVTPARSAQMMALLKRDYSGKSYDPDDQAHGFTGIALEPGARLWSKAGWTSTTRHDAAYIELPDGARFVLVTFTTDKSAEREIIPTVARTVMQGLAGHRKAIRKAAANSRSKREVRSSLVRFFVRALYFCPPDRVERGKAVSCQNAEMAIGMLGHFAWRVVLKRNMTSSNLLAGEGLTGR